MLLRKAGSVLRKCFGIAVLSGALVFSSFTGVMATELDSVVEESTEETTEDLTEEETEDTTEDLNKDESEDITDDVTEDESEDAIDDVTEDEPEEVIEDVDDTEIDRASFKEETENNNERSSANAITFNEAYVGKIETAGDKDWFKVTIPGNDAGSLSVTFWHGDCESNGTNGRWIFTIYTDEGQLYSKNVLGGSEASVTSDVYNLPAGTYYIEVKAFRNLGGLGWCSDDYTITANFQSASGTFSEREFNDSWSSANTMDLNRGYNGRISNSGLIKDQDFFTFKIDVEREVSFTFWHDGCDNTDLAAWDINLYNMNNGTLVSKIKESVKGGAAASVTSKTEVLPAGTYYVEISPANVAVSRNSLYTITVNSKIPSTLMYRLYNPNSGEHFWTGSETERDNLVKVGWTYEGPGWDAPTKTGESVYRFYSAKYGDHHYTMRPEEIAALNASSEWKNEGVCWNSCPGGRPMYRLYNPNAYATGMSGAHHYTMSETERDNLVSIGWIYEGIGWYSI